MLDRAISRPTSSCTSLDGDECPFSPFSKREYLLAQMRQKYDLIDYLLEQAHLSHILLTKYMRILLIILSRLSLPRFIVRTLSTPVSIEEYRKATPTAGQHRQNVIAWLDRLQSSTRSPRPSRPASNAFRLDTRADKSAGRSDESDKE